MTLSWAQDSKFLAFIPAPDANQLRLLNVTASGSEVTPASKPFAIHGTPTISWSMAYMTPDARTVFIACNTSRAAGLARLSIPACSGSRLGPAG